MARWSPSCQMKGGGDGRTQYKNVIETLFVCYSHPYAALVQPPQTLFEFGNVKNSGFSRLAAKRGWLVAPGCLGSFLPPPILLCPVVDRRPLPSPSPFSVNCYCHQSLVIQSKGPPLRAKPAFPFNSYLPCSTRYEAEVLVKEYLLSDSFVPYTSVLGGIFMCKMAYDLTHLVSSYYVKGYPSLTKIQRIEWSNRGMSSAHAVYITIMSLYLVFFSHIFAGDAHGGFIVFRSSPLSIFTLGVSVGYFITDLAMILWLYPSLGGMEYVARIFLFIYLFYHVYQHYEEVRLMDIIAYVIVFAVPSVLAVMNMVWFGKILRGLQKTLAKRQ
ncbi:hypothetical protein Taro_006123 [Colocasia esculenta]|uniref:TLC domain-containing protein n=1 Tax=Colocasia esculenta TaxID=4460 RepID=A0A843TRM3_COLES|nr:hypothetical protein [Colocasia esculenta]